MRTTAGTATGGERTASFAPASGRDPSAELRTAETVAEALAAAVDAFCPDGVADGGTGALETLSTTLGHHLETEHFLWLHVTSQGFRVGNTTFAGDSQDLAARLAAAGVVELLFKKDVTRWELERCVGALQPVPEGGAHSAATRLWEAGLKRIVFRCSDEVLGVDDARIDLSRWRSDWPEGSSALEHENLVRSFSGSRPEPNGGGGTWADWRDRVGLTAEDRVRLQRLRIDEPDAATERFARCLASLHHVDGEAMRGGESLVLLGDVVESLVAQRKFVVLRDVLDALREDGPSGAASDATLGHVVQRLCSERSVLVLGRLLEDPDARPEDQAAVRAILPRLPGAVDPLCRLLVRLEDVQARRLACRVLAFVAKEEPHVLAERAQGQPWYLARNVAYVLGRIGSGRVLPMLRRWTHHEDERVRLEVARALGRVHEADSSRVLADMLEDPSWRVRQSAVWSMAELRDPRALPRLRELLFEDRTFRSRRAEERDDFFRTYGRIADTEAFTELVRLLEQRQIVPVGWHAELRRGAVIALGETGRAEAVRVLEALEKTRDARLREAVAEALRTLRAQVFGPATLAGRRAQAARVRAEIPAAERVRGTRQPPRAPTAPGVSSAPAGLHTRAMTPAHAATPAATPARTDAASPAEPDTGFRFEVAEER